MKIAVRLDDITPDMDWERFLKFKALLDKYQVKPLIGVVPDNRDDNLKGSRQGAPDDFWAYIRELQEEGWSVAMHGYRHIYSTQKGGMFPLNNFSEFAGISYEEQLQMLTEGKKILAENGIETDIFMAPAHSYDKDTIKALIKTGFNKITDGFGTKPYVWRGITFYPISFRLENTFKNNTGYSTMVVHTGTIKENEWTIFESYFKKENVKWISFSEYMKQVSAKRKAITRLMEYLLAKGKFCVVRILQKI